MDDFTKKHLETWLEYSVCEDERETVRAGILDMLQEHPDLIEKGRSWPEIRNMAERKNECRK